MLKVIYSALYFPGAFIIISVIERYSFSGNICCLFAASTVHPILTLTLDESCVILKWIRPEWEKCTLSLKHAVTVM